MQARSLGLHILVTVNQKSGSGTVLCDSAETVRWCHVPRVAVVDVDKEAHLAKIPINH